MKRFYIIIMIFSILWIPSGCSQHKGQSNSGTIGAQKSNSNGQTGQSPKDFLHEIIVAAKKGKVPGQPYVSGKTNISTIEKDWGKSKDISNTKAGIYATYADNSTVFGYYHHSPVFDVRSYSKQLHSITLTDVTKAMGKPDKISYYNSKSVHQQISVYQLGNQDELRWVTTKPDDQNPNPVIDHISVYNPHIALHSVAAEVNDMTLDEKIGQMLMVGVNGTKPGSDADKLIKQDHAGGIILYGSNIQSPAQTVQFTNQLKALNTSSHNPIPLFISVDEEGGLVDRMPSPILKLPSSKQVGKVDDAKFSYQVGQTIGNELDDLGFNMDYAPVLDVDAHPGKSVIGSRSLGSNPDEVSHLGVEIMNGIQSQNVVSVIKHFPGYGSIEMDAHKDLPSIQYGLDQLQKVDWVPYKNAIANGADAVMVTHLLVPQLKTVYPASMSHKIITDMLRTKLGYQGVVMTDDMTMGAIENHYNIKTAAVRAVQAGADIVMVAFDQNQQEDAYQALKQAVTDGTISKTRIDDSIYRIVQLKQKYNFSDHAVVAPDISQINKDNRTVINRAE